jgi:autotransporter-associated beta strand protein
MKEAAMHTRLLRTGLIGVVLGGLCLPFAGDAAAQTWTGAGAGGLWSASGNWSTGLAGATVTSLVFTGSTAVNASTNDLVTAVNTAISFTNTVGGTANAVTLAGTGTVSFNGATPITSLSTTANVTDEIAFPIRFAGGNKLFSMGSAHNLRISGVISEDGTPRTLTKGGQGGTLVLTGENLFTGQMIMNVGNVQTDQLDNLSQPSPLGAGNLPVRIGNGAQTCMLIYTGPGETTNRNIQVGAGAASTATGGATITNNGAGAIVFTATSSNNSGFFNVAQAGVDPAVSRMLTLNGSSTAASTIHSKIVNNVNTSVGASLVALTKSGAGTWVLAGANDYTGGTTVTAGRLYVNGSLAATGNAVTVASGATLGGSGTVGTAGTVSGIVSPGYGGIGTLSFAGGLTWNGGATAATATDWAWDLGAANAADLAGITGSLSKGTGSVFRFDFGGTAETGTFTLASWTGTTSFAPADFSYTNLAAGSTATFDIIGNSLLVTVVPEPSAVSLAVLGFAGVAFGLARRGRRS